MANILTHAIQNNFLSGVLDPRVQGRVDTNAYISSMLTGTNIELSHLGGVSRRRGSKLCLQANNKLVQLTGTYAVPESFDGFYSAYGNGVYIPFSPAQPANVTLGSNEWGRYLTTTTTAVGVIDPYVVVSVDLGSPEQVWFADAICFSLSGGESVDFTIQYSSDNTNWTTLLALPQVDALNSTAGYSYRAAGPVTARYWRLARTGSASNLGAAVVNLGDFTLWGTTNNVSNGRLIPFEVSINEQYALVLTDHTGVVVAADGGGFIQNIPLPYASADLPGVDAQSSGETICLVHESYPPIFLIRQNSPLVLPVTSPSYASYYNFQPFPVIFDAVPQVYFADSLSPTPTSDVQALVFSSGWNVGDTFTITLQTDTTGPIVYAGDDYTAGGAGYVGATSKAIALAVQALWAVNGYTGVSCAAGSSAYKYTLTFAGAAAAPIGALAITSLSSNATAAATETTVGVSAQENLWSPGRGYPGTVAFFQGRLFFGGFLSQQESIVGSWVNNILAFNTAQGLDDQAIYVTMAGVALNAISGLFPGKSFCVFTTGGEFRFVNDQDQPIVPTSAPQNQTQYGSAHLKPVMIDGNIVFVQRNLKSLRDFQFDYTVDQYNSLGISALAPNLIYNVNDFAAWLGSLDEEVNLLFVCNGTNSSTDFDAYPNGSCAVFNTRKETSVQAWVNWQTQVAAPGDSLYMNVCTVVQNILFLVKRTINGTPSLFLEQPVEGTYTDSHYYNDTSAAGLTQITGLFWLTGATVRVLADGYVLDSQIVVGGVVPLTTGGQPYTVKGQVEIGLNFNPTITPMPVQTVRWPAGSNLAHKKRIQSIRVKVRETQGLYANGNLLAQTTMDQFQMDSGPAPLYTGIIELEESTNWDQDKDKLVTFTQVDPLPMQILFMDVELSGEQ